MDVRSPSNRDEAERLLDLLYRRRSVRRYRPDRVPEEDLTLILEAGRWAPSGADTQPWQCIVVRDPGRLRAIRDIYDREWNRRKAEDPKRYRGLRKDFVGEVSVAIVVCGDPRTKAQYLTTRQPADRDRLYASSIANAVEHMLLVARALGWGTVWVSVRSEIEEEMRALLRVPQEMQILWCVPVGRPERWPPARPRYPLEAQVHREVFDPAKLRGPGQLRAWPAGSRARTGPPPTPPW